jgi:DNA-binding NtrC family response regulator
MNHPELSPANGASAAMPSPSPGPVQVWLVDDHATLRTLIAESLERQGGIICTRQFDSPNALLSALASRLGPDVILLDVQMGELSGLDAIPAIKSLSRSTRVLMLTTYYDYESHQVAMEAGASDFLLKTYPVERIAQSVYCRSAANEPLRRLTGRSLRQRRKVGRCQAPERMSLDMESPPAVRADATRRSRPGAWFRWLDKLKKA